MWEARNGRDTALGEQQRLLRAQVCAGLFCCVKASARLKAEAGDVCICWEYRVARNTPCARYRAVARG